MDKQQKALGRLEQHLETWRQRHSAPTPIPTAIWSEAVKLAAQLGVAKVSKALRLNRTRLKRLSVTQTSGSASPMVFVELDSMPITGIGKCVVEVESSRGARMRISLESPECSSLVALVREFVLSMLQITPQMRVLVAVESIDGRKGIDSLAQLCREKLAEDPFSGCLFLFRTRSHTSIRALVYDGNGFWICQKRLSKGTFKYWPDGQGGRSFEAHQVQTLLAGGDPSTRGAPIWRAVGPRTSGSGTG